MILFGEIRNQQVLLSCVRWYSEFVLQNSWTLVIVLFIPQTTRIFKSSGDRPGVPNVALFLWDGNTNVRPELLTPAAIAARNQGIHIIAFGVGTDVDNFEMRNVASEPKNDTIFIVASQRNLSSMLSGLVKATCDSKYFCSSCRCVANNHSSEIEGPPHASHR